MNTFSSAAAQAERDKLFPPASVEAVEQQQAQGRSFEEYRANRPDYSVLPTADELAAQGGEREGERDKGDGRGDATHIAASKPVPGDELAAVAYGFKEGETPNERALQNASENQPRHDGAAFAAAAILATEQSNAQQPDAGERDKLFPAASVEAVEQQQAQERGFEQYRANGENYAALQPQQEQDGPAPTRPGEQAERDKLFPPESVAYVEQQTASMGRQRSTGYGLG